MSAMSSMLVYCLQSMYLVSASQLVRRLRHGCKMQGVVTKYDKFKALSRLGA
jgi:hypothetical protein